MERITCSCIQVPFMYQYQYLYLSTLCMHGADYAANIGLLFMCKFRNSCLSMYWCEVEFELIIVV